MLLAPVIRAHIDCNDRSRPDSRVDRRFDSRVARACLSSVLHSHTTITCQPRLRNCLATVRSRSMFASNFVFQNLTRDFGMYAYLQPGCRCQKQPCMKTTVFRLGSAISGRPGRSGACRRNRNPSRRRTELTTISGCVSRPRIRDMFVLLCCWVSLSVMSQSNFQAHSES